MIERRFELRKQEIEEDATINPRTTAGAVRRLQQFGEPYFKDFRRSETRTHAQLFIEDLFSDLPKKNIESIAYRSAQDRQVLQRFIGQVAWLESSHDFCVILNVLENPRHFHAEILKIQCLSLCCLRFSTAKSILQGWTEEIGQKTVSDK